jgi:heterodisulfide reductase subunit A-like polyferredoxin
MSPATPSREVTGAVLVVGGGIAGIQASLDLAEQGFRVLLVERSSAIGGHMAQLDKTFPTNDCAMCTISPKLVDVGRHLNIDIFTDCEVLRVDGEPGDFRVTLRRSPRYIDTSKCVGCGDCAEVCPVVLPDSFNEGLSTRRAAYKLYPQAVPSAYAIDKKGTAPCRDACPAGQRAQGYIALIAQGRYREAFRVIKEDNPFPSVCGRTCHHPCEGHCSRALVDQPVGIMALKRFVVDYALAYGREKVEPSPRTRPGWVAVVGAGPAGLTAAHDLARLGYGVTVLEALPVAGGMMRVGIPAHRLPKGVLQQDIDDILALGVVLRTDSPIEDPTALLDQGYNAVCLATGISSRDHTLGLEGEDSEGVLSAATFLRKVNLGEPITVGRRVAVIGGGITALDAAAVARRLGAEEVCLVLDRPRGELPAYHWEVAAVEAEGIHLFERTTATRILSHEGKVVGVELARTGKGMLTDEMGRRRPTLEPGTESTLAVDTVIGTVGQQSDLTFLDPQFEDLSGDPKTLASSIPGVFVVGGRKTGASYIVEAVALGHRVASSIDRYLRGASLGTEGPPPKNVVKLLREQAAQRVAALGTVSALRHEPALLPAAERVTSFREVVLGLTERQARAEAQRCLQCGVCAECLACSHACGTDAIDHGMVERLEQVRVGAVILTPGYSPYQAEQAREYGLGRYPNVLTSLQLERMLSASGPTLGQVQRPSDGKVPRRVAILQCVGSRDRSHDYCSSVCCMVATKQAVLLTEHHPGTEVHIFQMDLRAFGKGYQSYARRARDDHGVRYTRCRISQLREDPETQDLVLRFRPDSPSASLRTERFDLAILSVGMEISDSVRQLARDIGVRLDDHGFCQATSLAPLETSRPGIFAAGPFLEPKDIPESVVDASGSAALAGAMLAAARGTMARRREYPPERLTEAEPPRIGVFVCHCGSNIAGFVDVEASTVYAAGLPDVVHADHLIYACSQDSTAVIQARIGEHDLNRIVIASCTPLTHGTLFADCLREAGLNPHLLAMANIRNQCSWVHSEQSKVATAKAKDLIRMAVARVAALEPLATQPLAVRRSALVIGGGAAGLTAALCLADQGFPVTLVEREANLGGNLRHLRVTLDPALDFSAFLTDLTERARTHPEITIHTGCELLSTTGFVGAFTSTLRRASGEHETVEHGVTIVATGAQEYRGPDHGLGTHARVLTQLQFEALLAHDPDRPASDLPLRQVVMIQCIGPGARACARTCCTTALKNALALKRREPGVQIIILFREMRTYGFNERLYGQALDAGIVFIRIPDTEEPAIRADSQDGLLEVSVFDPILARRLIFQPDLLVLSMPMVPSEGSRELASRLKVPVDLDGWFLEAHVKLRPVEFASDGLFVAGAAHYPKLLDETIAQAQAAASRAAAILAHDTLDVGGAIAQVKSEACVGCLTCLRVCPFEVPRILPEVLACGGTLGAAYIEPALCRGCGTCIGECPARAIELRHYTHGQMERQVASLFEGRIAGEVSP